MAAIPKGLTVPLPAPDPAAMPLLIDVPLTFTLILLVVCADAEHVSNSAMASGKQCESWVFIAFVPWQGSIQA